ncbi:MAG: hypothetical protein OXG80_05915 [Chloroflexi bacterium]|nr:hypothetical protein [Chloroflexota bacterium]
MATAGRWEDNSEYWDNFKGISTKPAAEAYMIQGMMMQYLTTIGTSSVFKD